VLAIRDCIPGWHWPNGQLLRLKVGAGAGHERSGKPGLKSYRKKQLNTVK